jgi:hypothetical protein
VITFKPGYRFEADGWSVDGEKISSPNNLAEIQRVLEAEGPILVDHRFLRGARGPATLVFDDYENFVTYLKENARSGDMITVWSLWPFMQSTKPLAKGKCPAEDGAVPEGGAY